MGENGTKAVFLDASGRRARRMRAGAAVVGGVALLLLIGFLFSVIAGPRVATFAGAPTPMQPPPRLHGAKLAEARDRLLRHIRAEHPTKPAPAKGISGPDDIRGAYYAPWRPNGLTAFQAHASDLTHVYPAWIALAADGGALDLTAWSSDRKRNTAALVRIARQQSVRIVPVVSNAEGGEFDLRRVQAMLSAPDGGAAVAAQLADFVITNNYAGLQIDLELLDEPTALKLEPWLRGLRARLTPGGRELSITLEVDLSDRAARALAASADYAVVMAYDEHEPTSGPGAVASAGFIDGALKRFARLLGAGKVVLGVGSYGYDWNTADGSAEVLTNQQAVALAARYLGATKPQDAVDFDPVALEPTFQYRDTADRLHEVWFLDAPTAWNALTLGRRHGVRGAALWALGMEDPALWNVFGRHAPPKLDLSKVATPEQVDFIGDGELLRVIRTPAPGSRRIDIDPASSLVTDEDYVSLPSGWLVERSGAPSRTIALTFDDGPDPTWTPRILKALKDAGVPATFFMIGQNVADHPDIVRRVYAAGHEIGSHSFTHPNMAHVGPERVRLELSATQRAFEATLGRSVALFRPPYNADSEPRSYGEIMPVAVAAQEGYVTAGETIDPNDWDVQRRTPDGGRVRLTGAEIEREVLAQLDRGQAVLLHDGGGDRSATVAALPDLIRQLKARGYRFTTVGGLEGHTRAQTMPPVPAADRWLTRIDGAAFDVRRIGGAILFWAFTAAIALGLLRIALMIGLSARPTPERPEPGGAPRVDVLVAAYNEEAVIVRTLQSLLGSRGVDLRVLVVDDGSKDGTYAAVEAEFGREPRVRLARKANGGKASALNVALAMSDAPVVVGVDADTQLAPDALWRVAAWFADPAIGAVAGNVKVGNRGSLATRWQSLEYVTSQNVDRRAMSTLNAITVVPGAIGGYRADALRAVGGYGSDTLAEDMDLTWRLRRAGWRIVNEGGACAFTEAPETLGALMKQRFRWTFGTLQCLWKHRDAVGRYGWFGGLALPTLWLFQFVAQVLAPFVDLQLLLAGFSLLSQWIGSLQHVDTPLSPDPMLAVVLAIYVAFMALEVAAGAVAYGYDGEDRRELWLLPTQRFVYRQIMYLVVWRSLFRALGGAAHGWGKLARTGTVRA